MIIFWWQVVTDNFEMSRFLSSTSNIIRMIYGKTHVDYRNTLLSYVYVQQCWISEKYRTCFIAHALLKMKYWREIFFKVKKRKNSWNLHDAIFTLEMHFHEKEFIFQDFIRMEHLKWTFQYIANGVQHFWSESAGPDDCVKPLSRKL